MHEKRGRAAYGRLEVLGFPAVFAVLALGLFSSTGRDDSYISYWPALTLAEQGEILNLSGERVEQSSSALHVLILAATRLATGAELADLGGWLGLLFGVTTVWLALRLGSVLGAAGARATALFTASSGCLLYWSLAGLETSLAAASYAAWCLAAGSLLGCESSSTGGSKWLGIALASLAVVLVRPEGFLVLGSVTVSLVALAAWSRGGDGGAGAGGRILVGRTAVLFTVVVAASALVMGVRVVYFGELFPEPVLAKTSGLDLNSLRAGGRYALRALLPDPFAWPLIPVWAVGLAVGVRAARRRPGPEAVWLVASLLLAANLGFIVTSGGDWMEAGRFLVPAIVPLALLTARGVGALPEWARVPATLGLAALQLAGAVGIARAEATGMPLSSALALAGTAPASPSWFERSNRIHQRDLPLARHLGRVVEALHASQRRPVRVLSRQMGMVMFYVARDHPGRIETLDRRGIVDRVFRSCPISNGVPRSAVGLEIDNGFAFRRRAELETCGIAPPDVLFDIGPPPSAKSIESYGVDLVVVYPQRGVLGSGSQWFPGAHVDGKAFIALPRERLVDLGRGWPIRLELPAR